MGHTVSHPAARNQARWNSPRPCRLRRNRPPPRPAASPLCPSCLSGDPFRRVAVLSIRLCVPWYSMDKKIRLAPSRLRAPSPPPRTLRTLWWISSRQLAHQRSTINFPSDDTIKPSERTTIRICYNFNQL